MYISSNIYILAFISILRFTNAFTHADLPRALQPGLSDEELLVALDELAENHIDVPEGMKYHAMSPKSPNPPPPDHIYKRSTGPTVKAPVVLSADYAGRLINSPAKQYINVNPPDAAQPKIAVNVLQATGAAGVKPLYDNGGTVVDTGAGALTLNCETAQNLATVNGMPSYGMDGSPGGFVNGSSIFIFADTDATSSDGKWQGIWSNSVAVDIGMKAAPGQAPIIRQRTGSISGANGGLRHFVQPTVGEQAWFSSLGSKGYSGRVAIWSNSAITELRDGVAIQWTPLLVQWNTGTFRQTVVGSTLYEITVPQQRSGPVTNRVAPVLHTSSSSYALPGTASGYRSWGADGPGGTQGMVYAFSNDGNGLYVARVLATQVATASAYSYWHPDTKQWTDTPSTIPFIQYMGLAASAIFYSPRHKTFIQVFAGAPDTKIKWRYLEAPADGLVPKYDGSDFGENLVKYSWSASQTLFQAPTSIFTPYIYGVGPNLGYFHENDIVNGGNKMLITWCSPAVPGSAYPLGAAVITFD